MEVTRKYNRKIFLLVLVVCHIILSGVLFYTSVNQYAYDFVSYTGITNADAGDVHTFLHEQSDTFYDIGQEKMVESGYGYSGEAHLASRFIRRIVPFVLLFAAVDVGISFVVFEKHKQEKNIIAELAKEAAVHAYKNQLLLEDAESERKKVSRFEENLYHQLKTPVTGLKLSLEEMEGEGESVALYQAKWEVDLLSRLIALLLKDRQISENKVRYHYALQDFSLLVLDGIREIEPLCLVKQKLIMHHGTDKLFLVKCDDVWITEAIVVLLENAVESDASHISCNIEKVNGKIIFSLLSHGVSIDQETMNHLFERFYSTKDNHYGIGLHMARRIVLDHHGSLIVKNSREGVLFRLSLPATDSSMYDVTDL